MQRGATYGATVQQLVQSNLLRSKMFQAVKMRNVMGSNSCHNLTQVQCKIETCPLLSRRVLNRYQCSQLWASAHSAPCAPAALPSCDVECYRLDRATVICGHFVRFSQSSSEQFCLREQRCGCAEGILLKAVEGRRKRRKDGDRFGRLFRTVSDVGRCSERLLSVHFCGARVATVTSLGTWHR